MTARDQRSRLTGFVLVMLALGVVCVLISLGNWQMRRLAWKKDLIAAVETRAYGTPVAAPSREAYDPARHAYQKVEIGGAFLHQYATRVKALTELGPGYWVMTPLDGPEGVTWVNRGFVPTDHADPSNWSTPQPEGSVTGILRQTEPEGTLLERNDPAASRWVSRDVEALSHHTGLALARPYFIDADVMQAEPEWPRGGMTRLTFRNSHLAYALTWYSMAAMLVAALVFVIGGRQYRDRKPDGR